MFHWPSSILGLKLRETLDTNINCCDIPGSVHHSLLNSSSLIVYLSTTPKKCWEISKFILQWQGPTMMMEHTLYLILLLQISWLVCSDDFKRLRLSHFRRSLLLASVAFCLAMQTIPSREHLHKRRFKPNFSLAPMPILLWMVF
jgi:hypothetical protein